MVVGFWTESEDGRSGVLKVNGRLCQLRRHHNIVTFFSFECFCDDTSSESIPKTFIDSEDERSLIESLPIAHQHTDTGCQQFSWLVLRCSHNINIRELPSSSKHFHWVWICSSSIVTVSAFIAISISWRIISWIRKVTESPCLINRSSYLIKHILWLVNSPPLKNQSPLVLMNVNPCQLLTSVSLLDKKKSTCCLDPATAGWRATTKFQIRGGKPSMMHSRIILITSEEIGYIFVVPWNLQSGLLTHISSLHALEIISQFVRMFTFGH